MTMKKYQGIFIKLIVIAVSMYGQSALAFKGGKANTSETKPFVGPTPSETTALSWPKQITAPKNSPNILLIMTDDVGFGSTSTFGGIVPTPTFDKLAAEGLRYNRFHTTALCSPTRASLLTGRYPHNVGMGLTTNWPTGYDGYNTAIPKSAATIAEILKKNGYNTAMFGKGHITPEWEMSRAGPFDRWPVGLGFEYFYGFLGADTSMFAPRIVENTTFVNPPVDDPAYHFDQDMANKAIFWIERQHATAPQKPFFAYYAPGTAHAPNHAPKEWLEKFRGQFDQGWDKMRQIVFERQKKIGVIPENAALTPRPDSLPAWSTLSGDQRRLYSRFMEAYAASLSYADYQIGRVIESIKKTGELDNTIIVYIQGDNGASTEGRLDGRLFEQSGVNNFDEDFDYMLSRIDDIGGPDLYPLNTGGWGWAMNAPFPWFKRIASHLGGTRNGVVISWPDEITDIGAIRNQFHHVSDVMPTLLEAVGIKAPEVVNGEAQKALDGTSMLYSFDRPDVASQRKIQVFEVFENLGIYYEGWMAGTKPVGSFWGKKTKTNVPLEDREWELYNLEDDFSQSRNLARSQPKKLQKMKDLFWVEAGRNNILPIHSLREGREGTPHTAKGRTIFKYYSGMTRIQEQAGPSTIGRSFSIKADVVLPNSKAQGVLVAQGGKFGGYAFYIHNGHAVFHYNAVDPRHYTIRTADPITAGPHSIVVNFQTDHNIAGSSGTVTISVDGQVTGSGRVEQTMRTWISHTEGRMIIIGFASGDIPQVAANHLLVKNIDVIGFYWGTYKTYKRHILENSVAQLFDWYRDGKISPHISEVFPLEKTIEAISALKNRTSVGKVIVNI